MASTQRPKAKLQRRFREVLVPRVKYQKILEKRPYPPGQHGNAKRRTNRRSDYGLQLDEKQKLSFIYNIRERQLRNYYKKASKMPGRTGENLLSLLERRLDAIVYRAGFAATIWASRQVVGHGHINVNGKRVDLPSYLVRPGDVITIREKMRKNVHIQDWMRSSGVTFPSYLTVDRKDYSVTLMRTPEESSIPPQVQIQLVVEFYNRLT